VLELEQPLWICARERAVAERLQPRAGREVAFDERRRRGGDERGAEIAGFGEPPRVSRLAGVDADARGCAPHQDDRRGDRVRGALEGGEVRVALWLERLAAVIGDRPRHLPADVLAREHGEVGERAAAHCPRVTRVRGYRSEASRTTWLRSQFDHSDPLARSSPRGRNSASSG
jgi:hypothetical protein